MGALVVLLFRRRVLIMAENLPDVLRKNETVTALQTLAAKTAKRIPPAQASAVYTTLSDGRVLDRAGREIFKPTPRQESPK